MTTPNEARGCCERCSIQGTQYWECHFPNCSCHSTSSVEEVCVHQHCGLPKDKHVDVPHASGGSLLGCPMGNNYYRPVPTEPVDVEGIVKQVLHNPQVSHPPISYQIIDRADGYDSEYIDVEDFRSYLKRLEDQLVYRLGTHTTPSAVEVNMWYAYKEVDGMQVLVDASNSLEKLRKRVGSDVVFGKGLILNPHLSHPTDTPTTH